MGGLCASIPYSKLGQMKSKVVTEAHLCARERLTPHPKLIKQ